MGEIYTSSTTHGKAEPSELEAAAAALCDGEVVAYPTETFYALGAHPDSMPALQEVLRLKGRDAATKPLLLLIDRLERVDDWVIDVPARLAELAERFWPGPLTLILRAAADVPTPITGGGDTVAVRLTSHPVARALIGRCGGALTGTSANPASGPPAVDAAGVRRGFGETALHILDAGTTPGGEPSTLLDLTTDEPLVRRAGAVSVDEIEAALGLL